MKEGKNRLLSDSSVVDTSDIGVFHIVTPELIISNSKQKRSWIGGRWR